MPLEPNMGKLFIELDGPDAVENLVETARNLDPDRASKFLTRAYQVKTDIEDHLLYLSAISPEWFQPYREETVGELHDRLPMEIGVASVLLKGLDDVALQPIAGRLEADPTSWSDLTLLAGVGSELALTKLADHVRMHPEAGEWVNRLGVHVPRSGPAVRRFSSDRYAITVADSFEHGTIGLGLDQVADDPAISWHYLSFRPGLVAGLPAWPHGLLHIVSPRNLWFSLFASVDSDGRYRAVSVESDEELFYPHMAQAESAPPPPAGIQVHPYDDTLTYRNGHIHMTAGVCGTAGGPPIGIYPNPVCPGCNVLMFHGASIESTAREYGEGFVSVFYCEQCIRTAVTGTSWN